MKTSTPRPPRAGALPAASHRPRRPASLALAALATLGCSEAAEAPTVETSVLLDAGGLAPATTDLGYRVELAEAHVALDDVEFALAGGARSAAQSAPRLLRLLHDQLVPSARAHPGHSSGGAVTGELRGHFVAAFATGQRPELGRARLIVGAYESANFTFGRASAEDVSPETSELAGHTALLRGFAQRDEQRTEFVALLDSPEGRRLEGAPFDVEIREETEGPLALRLLLTDPVEGDALFDGIDFSSLPPEDGRVIIENGSAPPLQAAHDRLRRNFQTHDYYEVTLGGTE